MIPLSLNSGFPAMHRRLFANLWQGLRLCALRSPEPRADAGQLLALLLIGWGCALLVDWLDAPPGAQLMLWGVAAEAARGYLWLIAIFAIASLVRERVTFLALAVALAAAEVSLWGLWLAIVPAWSRYAPASFDSIQPHLWQFTLAWQVAMLRPALQRAPSCEWLRNVACLVVYASGLAVSHVWLPDTPLFDTRATAEQNPLDIEQIYTRQAALLHRSVREVMPGIPGQTNLFVLTFAGFGGEAVFKREALQAARILGALFAAEHRTLRLINNAETLDQYPLANQTNLRRALRGIAKKMKREDDILLLFMTSHGSKDGQFAVELGDLGLHSLRPEDLREALDNAGIRWRIVVLSACYSGQFVDALRSPETLVITASAKDKKSFGCAHENAWTYFGDAYFKEALRQTHSFTAAFERARDSVDRRERQEGKEPSAPQMDVGERIGPILKRFEAQFEPQPSPITMSGQRP